MLDAHPDLLCGPELSILGHPLVWQGRGDTWRKRLLDCLDLYPSRPSNEQWNLDHGAVPYMAIIDVHNLPWYGLSRESLNGLILDCDSVEDMVRGLVGPALMRQRKRFWAEKSPPNLYAMPLFLERYPEGKAVVMVRDGRDVVCSLLQRGFTLYEASSIWLVETTLSLMLSAHPRVKLIRYEDLVGSPARVLSDLNEFLDLPPANDVQLRYHEHSDRVVSDSSLQVTSWTNLPTAAISSSAVGRWRRDLSVAQLEVFYRHRLHPGMRRLPDFGALPTFDTVDLLKALDYELPVVGQSVQSILVDLLVRERPFSNRGRGALGMHRTSTELVLDPKLRQQVLVDSQTALDATVTDLQEAESVKNQMHLAGALAENESRRLAEELADLRRQLDLKSGIRGGVKEALRSIWRRLWPTIDFADPRELPSPWRLFDPSQAATGGRRVLVLSHMFPHPTQPGSGPFVLEQVKALRNQAGIDARVIVGIPYWMNMKQQPWQFLARNRAYWHHVAQAAWHELEGVPVLYVPYRAILGFWNHGWMYRAAMARAIEAVRADFAFDCVHAHASYLAGSAGRWIARRYGVPLVITEHTGPFSMLTDSPIVRRETVASLATADCVIAVSTAQKRDIQSFMAAGRHNRLIVLPNGVDTDLFLPPTERRGNPAAPRFVFVGFLADCKNLPLLLEAFTRVLARLPAARLSLVGSGSPQAESELRQMVENLRLSDSVEFTGFQDRVAVARILSEEADFLVLSSHSESFGCVVTEAMACGLPVISTRCGGPEDVITEPWLGRLCENHNPEALAQAMIDAAVNIDRFDPQRIRRYSEERFSYSALAANLDGVYRQLITHHQKTP